MARFVYPDLTDDLAAVVSTHGYFEIQRREGFTGYASGFSQQTPPPTVVHAGPVSELGIVYNPYDDDLDWENEPVDEGRHIRDLLWRWLKTNNVR